MVRQQKQKNNGQIWTVLNAIPAPSFYQLIKSNLVGFGWTVGNSDTSSM